MPDREEGSARQSEEKAASQSAPGQADIRGLAGPPSRLEIDYLKDVLKRVVKADVVPRLVLADKALLQASSTGTMRHAAADQTGRKPTASEAEAFQVLVLHRDTFECFEFVNRLREKGISLPDLYLGLFSPLARELGTRWENDELSFVDVTKAMGRLQSLVHTFSQSGQTLHPIDAAHRVVLASSPEEQHVLGMLIVSKLFEMDGWEVSGGPGMTTGPRLNNLVHDEWFGVVGLTASSEERAIQLKKAIDEIRRTSRNQGVCVIVGGHGFDEHPEISADIGADELVTDAADAVTKAEKLIASHELGKGSQDRD